MRLSEQRPLKILNRRHAKSFELGIQHSLVIQLHQQEIEEAMQFLSNWNFIILSLFLIIVILKNTGINAGYF